MFWLLNLWLLQVIEEIRLRSKTASPSQKKNIGGCMDAAYQLRWAVLSLPSPPTATAHISIGSLWTGVARTTGLAPPTVYFQQLGFGLRTHQAQLPTLRSLDASSAPCPPWQEMSTKKKNTSLEAEAGDGRQPPALNRHNWGRRCWGISQHSSHEKSKHLV